MGSGCTRRNLSSPCRLFNPAHTECSMGEAEALLRLGEHYRVANGAKFGGTLPDDYRIALNPRLRRLTGRITYGWRLIEISDYHFRQYGYDDAVQTLEHEMLHLY